MTYATANTNPYIAHRNLSATIDHYGTYIDLCSTKTSTLEACSNLSTAANLQHQSACGARQDLSSTIIRPFRPCNNRSDYCKALQDA